MVRRGWPGVIGLLVGLLLLLVGPTTAQGSGALLAFVNSSGQLVVASGDGSYRWIVTNPGEVLNSRLGYAWSPGGALFFALGENDISLRRADPASQQVSEFGRASGPASGGTWTLDGQAVLIASANRLMAFPASGGGPIDVAAAPETITLRSPFDPANDRPHLAQARTSSPDGQFLFYALGSSNVVQPVGGAPAALPGGDPNSGFNGLWANAAPLVAYTGYNGNSFLAVTNAANGATLALDSGRTAPINPVAWRPGTLQLIYRDASNTVRLADVSCLTGGCPGNPLQAGEALLPGSAAEIQTDGTWVYFVDGTLARAVNLACVGSGACLDSAVTLGSNVVPQTIMDASGGVLAYTGYSTDAYNPADRDVRVVNLGCLSNPATCAPISVLAGAMAGLVSPDGGHVVVEQVGGPVSIYRLSDGLLTYLSDPAGASLLPRARWNG